MSINTAKPTATDVARLLEDPSPANRALVGQKVASSYSAELEPDERAIAEDILRQLLRDAEVRVRQALAESAKDNGAIPHDVAIGLASDVADVATPILSHSVVLSDDDLLSIIAEQSTRHQMAVAGRVRVSSDVAEALADTQDEAVVSTLVANDGAELSEPVMQKVVDAFGERERVNVPLAQRRFLPISISERLVTLVSEQVREHLVTHHDLSPGMASDLIRESRERATMSLLDDDAEASDVITLVDQLAANGRLTPTIVMHAICMGDLVFFEAALAKICNISRLSAYTLIADKGDKGLAAIGEAAGFSEDISRIVQVAVEVARETDYDGENGDRERFVRRMLERVLTACEDGFEHQDLEYFLAKLQNGASAFDGAEKGPLPVC